MTRRDSPGSKQKKPVPAQIRNSYLRNEYKNTRRKSSESYSPNEYAEDQVEEHAEAAAAAMRNQARRAAETRRRNTARESFAEWEIQAEYNAVQEAGRQEFLARRWESIVNKAKTAAQKLRDDIRAILKNNSDLASFLAIGGGIVLVLAVIVLLIGAVGGSGFGIFFSAGDDGEYTIRTAMNEINQEYLSQLDTIKAGFYFDEFDLSGARAGWREVLAVYAVKNALDPVMPTDVVTMTPEKKDELASVFWAMNELTVELSSRVDIAVEETEDEEGNPVEEEVETTVIILSILIQGRSVYEVGDEFGFTEDQWMQLQELLSPEYGPLWSMVMYGVSVANGDIVSVALSQVGNVGGEPYWSWYGFPSRVEWCACFVSWCANEAGYIESGIIPKFAFCPTGAAWFQNRGQWAGRNFTPTPGCLIFYDWESDGEIDHVGIVESCEGGVIHTVEGNTGDACKKFTYLVGSSFIAGYGIPAY